MSNLVWSQTPLKSSRWEVLTTTAEVIISTGLWDSLLGFDLRIISTFGEDSSIYFRKQQQRPDFCEGCVRQHTKHSLSDQLRQRQRVVKKLAPGPSFTAVGKRYKHTESFSFFQPFFKKRCEMYLKVLQGELQHVSEDITEDLCLPLHQHILIVQRLDHLRFHLQKTDEKNCYWNIWWCI